MFIFMLVFFFQFCVTISLWFFFYYYYYFSCICACYPTGVFCLNYHSRGSDGNILRAELRNMLRAGFVNIKGRTMGRAQAGVHWGPSSEIHWGPSSKTYWGPSSGGNILRARQERGSNGNILRLNLVGLRNVLACHHRLFYLIQQLE